MMMQVADPAIKLFGKTIPFCSVSADADCDAFGGGSTSSGGGGCGGSCSDNERALSDGCDIGVKEIDKVTEPLAVNGLKQKSEDGSVNGNIMGQNNENQKMGSGEEEIANGDGGARNVTVEADSKEKTPLKKPDKVLPCPRCNSMDTKFCYYNNYNVLQPRHFCKGCQRYWTAGGAMRNVPVGAGRRKSKNAAVQNRYLTISDVLHASGAGSSNGFVPCQTVLKCGSATNSGSAASVSNVTQMPFLDPAKNTTHKVDEGQGMITKVRRVGDNNSSGSCVTASNDTESTQQGHTSSGQSFSDSRAQIPCIPAWPYSWNPAIPPPAFPQPGFALPFFPPSYWPCTALPNTWNAPWLASQSLAQTSTNSMTPVLGKHSRDVKMIPENKSGKLETTKQPAVLTPKTLRIDHPEEAAKSSIWETLGIKNETLSKGGLFRDLKSKETEKHKHVPENYAHLTSNPAALSRSLNFQEVS